MVGRYPVKLLSSSPGRGTQQNVGAAAASGGTLLFLHCDTRLPDVFCSAVQETLDTPGTVAGAFCLAIDHPGRPYRLIEAGANLRSRLLQLPYGDQALVMKKHVFEQVGGFPNQPIMEEFPLLARLRRLGKIRIVHAPATTSARRWQRLGIFKTTILNQLMLTGMALGVSPYRLARLYSRL